MKTADLSIKELAAIIGVSRTSTGWLFAKVRFWREESERRYGSIYRKSAPVCSG